MAFKEHIGLDVGSQLIKLVQLSPDAGDKYRLVGYGSALTPREGNLVEIESSKVETIKKLIKDSKVTSRQAVISLPESQVFTRVIELPIMPEDELAQSIHWQAEQYIPVPLSDVVLKHQVLTNENDEEGKEKMMKVLLVAAPTSLLNSYVNLMGQVGLEVLAIETEILAVARALVGTDVFSPTSLIVHLGAETTTLSVLARGDLALTQSISTGGLAITRAVSSSLGIDFAKADEYKKSYGLDNTKVEGKVVEAIKPIVEMILSEVKRSLTFYDSRDSQNNVKRVVLSGGTALLPALVSYFTSSLSVEVQVGNPFLAVNLADKQKAEIGDSATLYSAAVGLALKPT